MQILPSGKSGTPGGTVKVKGLLKRAGRESENFHLAPQPQGECWENVNRVYPREEETLRRLQKMVSAIPKWRGMNLQEYLRFGLWQVQPLRTP